MSFQPFLWLGDEERGLAWFCESNANWFGKDDRRGIEITLAGDAVDARFQITAPDLDASQIAVCAAALAGLTGDSQGVHVHASTSVIVLTFADAAA